MKVFVAACAVLALTVSFMFFTLDAGANEADLCLFLAPVNSLCGLALCILAFKRRLKWVGILGLSMMVIWPFFTLALAVEDRGVVRQSAAGAIATAYAILGILCFCLVKWREWGSLTKTQAK